MLGIGSRGIQRTQPVEPAGRLGLVRRAESAQDSRFVSLAAGGSDLNCDVAQARGVWKGAVLI